MKQPTRIPVTEEEIQKRLKELQDENDLLMKELQRRREASEDDCA